MSNMLSEALDYARRGWYVFPCREKPGASYVKNGVSITPTEKQPYVYKGLHDASIDPEQIKAWWQKWPDALIGINAGKSGLFVVDIDKKHINGLDTWQSWNINDTAALQSITPSGGMHVIFTGIGKTSTNGKTGIDTRSEGGYFIAPPSKILEGENVGEYTRFNDWGRVPGVIPDGLMTKLFPDSTVEYVRGNFIPTDGSKKQLSRSTLNFLANGAPRGERNHSLFKASADFAGCGYTQEETKQVLVPVCHRIGLDDSEIEITISHAYAKARTSSIPDSIQEKIMEGKRTVTSKITSEEQTFLESALLACLIQDNNLIPVVGDILRFEDFHTFRNRVIYKALGRLYNSGMKADFVTVSNEVAKETDKISMDDVSKMIHQYYVDSDNVLTYANIIREKASIRQLESLMDNKEKYIKSGNLVDIINNIEKDVADIAVYGGAKSTNVMTALQATEMVADRTNKISTGEIQQIRTGFSEYDNNVGGLYTNELVICAGRAGEGKSALALSIANEVGLRQQKPVLFFSLEMSTHETICRLICQLTGIPFKKVYQGKMVEKEWKDYNEAKELISKSNMYFDDSFGITIPELRSKMRKMMEKDIKLVIIDQLEQIKGYEGLPLYQQFDKIAYDIKNFTKEFGVPIILNHQLNRSITDRKLKNPEPQLSDLNQAGEKPADQVWVISHHKDEKGKILQSKIKVLKNRNGAQIEFAVIFVGDRMLFSNPAREEDRHVFQAPYTYRNEDDSDDDYSEPGFMRV